MVTKSRHHAAGRVGLPQRVVVHHMIGFVVVHARLDAVLHELDAEGLDWIAVELPPNEPEWAAIHDRLRRAAGALGS